jgi:prepilin-type N-terminal cleavage/methylation domain-containing protein
MREGGFTLIEVMLSVAIIAILSAIVIPSAADALRASVEARTKANLNAVRVALAAYNTDFGHYPTDHLGDLIDKGYLPNGIPMIWEPPYHSEGNGVCVGPPTQDTLDACTDAYVYDNDQTSPSFGTLILSCIHSDLKGHSWSSY